jgi:hypothetical protein
MNQSVENKIEIKDKLVNFYNNNRLKIFSIIFIVLVSVIAFYLFKQNQIKKNNLVAEQYIKAGIYLSSNKKDDAKRIFQNIILSKNEFYSVLALNQIIEKNLISDKNKILEYFDLLEKINRSEDKQDLISLKKALYLIKMSDVKEGEALLENLIDKNSELKSIAKEIILE